MNELIFKDWIIKNIPDFDALLFDIDGTLVTGPKAASGAVELIEFLRSKNFPFLLLTNDGDNSPEEKSRILNERGIKIFPEEIISCAMALEGFVDKYGYRGEKFFLMGKLGNPGYAEKTGLTVEQNVDKITECAGIIVGEGFYDWHKNFHAVLNELRRNPDKPFVVPNPDIYWPDHNAEDTIGIGAGAKAGFITSILKEMGIIVEPYFLGKPHRSIFDFSVKQLVSRYNLNNNIDYKRILMIGDSLKSDIAGANAAGMSSALVLSGITGPAQAENASGRIKPDYIFYKLGE